MKLKLLLSAAVLLTWQWTTAQGFDVSIEPMTIPNAPNVHSFSVGQTDDGKWVIIGGRIDGLHRRQPFAAFLESANNKDIAVIDPVGGQAWTTSLSTLPASVFEQLQSTNQQFYQRGNTLYITGGYGYSATEADHVTYPYLTAVDLNGVANAIINGTAITGYFRQIMDSNLAVTGGQIGYHDSTFYLCGGQYFKGRYNPMGPNFGPGFTQIYTNEVRKFKILDDGTNLSITNYTAINDSNEFHRRDYNMSPQIFPDGQKGFTMWSGVFDSNDLPYLNTVNVFDTGYSATPGFNQYLSNYHSAKLPLYDQSFNEMYTIFFGGMSQYTLDDNGNLVQDDNVPFVKTISKITRFADGTMSESKLSIEMPTLLGSGTEFIPIRDKDLYIDNEIVRLNTLTPGDSVLVGYLYGGIESTQPNIFFSNNGSQSDASSSIYKVYIKYSPTGVEETVLSNDNILQLAVFPNPSNGKLTVSFFIPSMETHTITVFNMEGKQVFSKNINLPIGNNQMELDLSNLPSGKYIIRISGSGSTSQKAIIIN